jgi:hypothetical protein
MRSSCRLVLAVAVAAVLMADQAIAQATEKVPTVNERPQDAATADAPGDLR